MFPYEYFEISKNIFSHRTPLVAASGFVILYDVADVETTSYVYWELPFFRKSFSWNMLTLPGRREKN